jgi:anti-sigma factor RsiW
MTECRTPELQDLLPDYLLEALDDAERLRVATHVAACDACLADLEVLRRVRRARPPVAPVDVAGIIAALPAAPAARSARPALQLERSAPAVRRAPARRWSQGPSLWRMAAAIGVVLTGGMSVLVARHGLTGGGDETTEAAQVSERASAPTIEPTAVPVSVSGNVPVTASERSRTESTVATAAGAPRADVAVSYGGSDDVTEGELQQLLDRLERWDGATNAEPLPSPSPVQWSTRGGTLP